MRVILDRYEEDYAVLELEGGAMLTIPKKQLPDEVREGDVLEAELEGDCVRITRILSEQSEARRKRIVNKFKKILNKEN